MASSHYRSHLAPKWKQLYECAILELDPVKLARLISDARSAILDRAEEVLTQPPDSERDALHHALNTLRIIEEVAEREKNAA